VSATDLWMAIASVRDPSVQAQPCQGHGRDQGPGHEPDVRGSSH
jgi:hypothetical protein